MPFLSSLPWLLSACTCVAALPAENTLTPRPSPEQESALLKEVKVPAGFEATIFAVPPAVNYPVFVSAAPDGTVYVSSDKNGSLDRAPNRGRILRVRDLDGDGHADEVKQFVPNVDSPRGLVWDRDRLYLLHPPDLSVYIDRDGDGVVDDEKVLVKNIAFTFKDRPADHSSNGIELGIDGWIYCAIGDFGFMEAEGTDGRKLQLRGGGVVRVRPDGTGLELYSHGTRNILEACVSPQLDLFARDNTNDGDGWDIRLHHFTGLSDHGYPSLFKNFKGEFIEPLADYGGGSGCGGLYLSEPGFPAGFGDALYTADWGREWIYRHNVTPHGATFEADQKEFVRAPRVTDLDVDALSHLYISSWKGATFTYVGENVGFLLRVSPAGYTPEPLPDFKKASEDQLIHLLESTSHRRRLEAQRELISRPASSAVQSQIERLAENSAAPLPTRIAAVFYLKQALGSKSHSFLTRLLNDSSLREYGIRALADRLEQLQEIPTRQITATLHDENPRVRQEALYALSRVKAIDESAAIASLLDDSDPTVAHTAMQALRQLGAADAAFAVLDSTGSSAPAQLAATRVLQALHTPEVVDGLIRRLGARHEPLLRHLLLTALCRLYYKDGEWKGDSWGTRPDTTGPYYQPATWSESDKIAGLLESKLNQASGTEASFLVQEFSLHKIQTEKTLKATVELANQDPALLPAALAQFARADRLPASAENLLIRAAGFEPLETPARAHAVTALTKFGDIGSARAMLEAMPKLAEAKDQTRDLQQARQAFLRTRPSDGQLAFFQAEAAKMDPAISAWADAILLRVSENKSATSEARESSQKALDDGWKDPKRKAQILQAVAFAEHRASKERVLESLDDSDPAISAAARKAAHVLRLDRELKAAAEKKTAPLLATLKTEEIIPRVLSLHGDARIGADLFTRQTCNSCHTVSPSEPLRGPFLGNIATIYKRDELARAILVPNNTIAQGFATHHFELKDGTEVDGFVVQEAADKVTIRTVAAQELQFKISEIANRTKLEKSLMPEGLVANLTLQEFASLLDYLQNLAK